MKTKLIVGIVASLFSIGAVAQVDVNAITNSNTASTSGAMNAGNAQNIHFNGQTPDKQTLKVAPSLGGNSYYGSFSSDNCMVSAGGSLSTIIGGGSVVAPVRDQQCALLRVFERTQQAAASINDVDPNTAARLRQASTDMLCQVSDEAKIALQNQGLCSDLNVKTIAAKEAEMVGSKVLAQSDLNEEHKIERYTYSYQLASFVENQN